MTIASRVFRYGVFPALIGLSVLAGCGGGGSDPRPSPSPLVSPSPLPSPVPTAAAVRVRVVFPTVARSVPQSAQSVVVELRDGATLVAQHVITRPDAGGMSEYVFENVPLVDVTVTTTAYGSTSGTGIALATGSQVVSNRTGAGAIIDIAMESTISNVAITSSEVDIEPGDSAALVAVARNAANQDVLTVPGNWQWASSNPSVATVEPSGSTAVIHGVGVGNVDIRATEAETGKSTTFSIPVLKVSPTLFVRDGNKLYWFNSRKARDPFRTTGLETSAIDDGVVLLDDGNLVVDYGDKVALVNRTTGEAGAASSSFGYGSSGADALLALPGGKVLVYNSLGFAVINPQTGVVESRNQLPIFSYVRDMTIGPDGKIYLIADSQDGQGSDDVIARLYIGANGIIQEEAILRRESGAAFSGLKFLSDGKLAILDRNAHTLRLYSVDSTTALPLASAVTVGDGTKNLTVGHSVFTNGDEIVYANTTNGIRRFSYKDGTFTSLDQEDNPFLYDGGNAYWEDVAIAPNN